MYCIRQAPLRHIRRCPGNHSDAVDDGAHAQAQSATSAAVSYHGEMGLRVKRNSLKKEAKAIRLELLGALWEGLRQGQPPPPQQAGYALLYAASLNHTWPF